MLDLQQLQYFRTVARLQHITKAANELHISQPNLSNAIKRLETSLGVQLFERRNGRIFLSEYGKVYLEGVERAFECLETAENKLRAMQTQDPDNQVAIASSMQHYNEHMIEAFYDKNPGSPLQISQSVMPLDILLKQLREGHLDAAIIPETELTEDLQWTQMFFCRVGIFLNEEHPLAKQQIVNLIDLKDEAFVCNNLGIGHDLTIRFCQKAGFQPKIRFESNDSGNIGKWLEDGRGIAFIPSYDIMTLYSIDQDSPPGLIVKPILEPMLQLNMGIVTHKGKKETGVRKQFFQFASDYFTDLGETIDRHWQEHFFPPKEKE